MPKTSHAHAHAHAHTNSNFKQMQPSTEDLQSDNMCV